MSDQLPGLDALCQAMEDGDAAGTASHMQAFAASNRPLIAMLEALSEAQAASGRIAAGLGLLELLERLLPDDPSVLVRRVAAAIAAGVPGAAADLVAAAGRLTDEPLLFRALEHLLDHGFLDEADALWTACDAGSTHAAGILATGRARIQAARGALGQALTTLATVPNRDSAYPIAMRCQQHVLELLLEVPAVDAGGVKLTLRWGEISDLAWMIDRLLAAFDFDAAQALLRAFGAHHPAKSDLLPPFAARLAAVRGAFDAAVAEHGPLTAHPHAIHAALSSPSPTRVLWGKASLAAFLRGDGMTEAVFERFLRLMPRWEPDLSKRVLAAARRSSPASVAVRHRWLAHLMALGAYAAAAAECNDQLAAGLLGDSLFQAVMLLRLQQEGVVPPFIGPALFTALRERLLARVADAEPGFSGVLHHHLVALGWPPRPWPTPAPDDAAAVLHRRLFATAADRLRTGPAPPDAGPPRPVVALSGHLDGFESAWPSIHDLVCRPAGAPVLLSAWDTPPLHASGRPGGPAALRSLIEASRCDIVAVETESEALLDGALLPHVRADVLKMVYKAARLDALLREQEVRTGVVFSHVIWMRPDCEILRLAARDLRDCLARTDVVWSSAVSENAFGDTMAVLPRRAFAVVAGIFQKLCLAGDTRLLPWHPHRPGPQAFDGPDVLFDMLLAAGYVPLHRIPRIGVTLGGQRAAEAVARAPSEPGLAADDPGPADQRQTVTARGVEQMDRTQAELFVRRAAQAILHRTPNPTETEAFVQALQTTSPADFIGTLEGLAAAGNRPQAVPHWPDGHYYSPVVRPDQDVRAYWDREQTLQPGQIQGIALDLGAMVAFWEQNAGFLLANPFPERAGADTRYGTENGSFPGGDAVFVGAIMRTFAPRRIIEIGSGNSTACMLDWRDRLGLRDLRITCIEPDPVRLRSILRPGDDVTIIEDIVQKVDLRVFDVLEDKDVLFIDSTHVLKTGSDVHYELFQVLPRLRPGVIVHFHDCAYPFEYQRERVFDMNFSWNEAYAVRAFLMYNARFDVLFWNSMFYRLCPPQMRETFATLSRNPGGGLWLRKTH